MERITLMLCLIGTTSFVQLRLGNKRLVNIPKNAENTEKITAVKTVKTANKTVIWVITAAATAKMIDGITLNIR